MRPIIIVIYYQQQQHFFTETIFVAKILIRVSSNRFMV